MDKAQGIQPKTLTEQMAEKTKEEQEKHRREEEEAQKAMEQNGKSSRDAYDFGRFLMGMFTGGFGWHLRRFVRYVITFLICAVSAAAGFFVCKYLPVWTGADLASYNGYLLIVGAVLAIVGIFCLRISYKKAKSIPLGLGIGLLLAYFLKLWL